jgi:hypothetical protein
MHPFLKARALIFLLSFLIFMGWQTAVLAQTVVEPLPENNLLQNPWFREGNRPSLAGWTDQAGSNVIWSTSQKQDNPTSDQVLGTSARLAFGSGQGGGTGQAGVDAALYQVVAADPAHTHLQFKTHWVTMWIDRAAVTIYGGNSADGPWTAVWTPLDINQATSSGGAWTQTELLDITIAQGFPFYKVELFGRYPDGRQQGVKYTGVYFTVDGNAGAVTEAVAPEPTAAAPAAPTDEPEPTRQLRETAVPPTSIPAPEESDQTAAIANTPAPEPTQPLARPTQPTRTSPAQTPPTSAPASDSISGVYLGIIAVLLLLVIFLGIGWARSIRR